MGLNPLTVRETFRRRYGCWT